MHKITTFLLGLVGRIRKMSSAFLAQFGAAALPLAVVVAMFMRDATSNVAILIFALGASLLMWIGVRAFQIAERRSRDEMAQQRVESARRELVYAKMIALLTALAKERGIDAEALLEAEDIKARRAAKVQLLEDVKKGRIPSD